MPGTVLGTVKTTKTVAPCRFTVEVRFRMEDRKECSEGQEDNDSLSQGRGKTLSRMVDMSVKGSRGAEGSEKGLRTTGVTGSIDLLT